MTTKKLSEETEQKIVNLNAMDVIIKIRVSIILSYFTRHLQRLQSFGSAEKSGKLVLLLDYESRVYLQCPENSV